MPKNFPKPRLQCTMFTNFDLGKIAEILIVEVYKILNISITHDLSFITLVKYSRIWYLITMVREDPP